jgi:hypothetical protein
MKTFKAWRIYNATNEEKTTGLVWWDGNHIRTSTETLMRSLRNMQIPGEGGSTFYKDGEKFFNKLPLALQRNYTGVERVEVDEKGNIQ